MRMFSMLAVALAAMGHSFRIPKLVSTGPQVRRGKKSSSRRFRRDSGSTIKGVRSSFNTQYGRGLKAKFDSAYCTPERLAVHKAYLAHMKARKSPRIGVARRLAA